MAGRCFLADWNVWLANWSKALVGKQDGGEVRAAWRLGLPEGVAGRYTSRVLR
jgi:hypothetical protein